MNEIKAWHFTSDTLRDGRPIPPVGEWLIHDGPIVPCESGLHASERLIDALEYAPDGTQFLHRATLRGDVTPHGSPVDKHVARERRIDWTLDEAATEAVLRDFARWCVREVLHLWDAPDVVVRYLETGDESLRDAAWAAARAAVRAATWAAAGAAARDAVRDATWAAAGAAARDAAGAAARAAAGAAAGDAAGAAAGHAAWDAARDAARAAQNTELTRLVLAAAGRTE